MQNPKARVKKQDCEWPAFGLLSYVEAFGQCRVLGFEHADVIFVDLQKRIHHQRRNHLPRRDHHPEHHYS